MKVFISVLILFFTFSGKTLSGEKEGVDEFLSDLSNITISSLCNLDRFLMMTKMSTDECVAALVPEAIFCNDLLRPFVPSGEYDEIKDMLDSLSLLYLSCMKGNGFESALSKTVKQKN